MAHLHAESQQCCAGLRGSREAAQAGCREWQRRGCPERARLGSGCLAGPAPAQASGLPCWPGSVALRLMTACPTGWRAPQRPTLGSLGHLHVYRRHKLHPRITAWHASMAHKTAMIRGQMAVQSWCKERVCKYARHGEELWAHRQWTSGCLRRGCGGLTHCAHARQCGC